MYHFVRPSETAPAGWLMDQLKLQASGLSGNLHKVWPDVRDSRWIGGDREGWERVPYWLDGFIPLAYELKDEALIADADRYVKAILDQQQEDGWICPCTEEERAGYDVWAFFLIGKFLALYAEVTGSVECETALYRAMKCLYEFLKPGEIRLFDWGRSRWFECMIPLSYLYERYPEAWIIELAGILKAEGLDYMTLRPRWVRPLNCWTHETHIVNLMMMLKYEAVTRELLGGDYGDLAEKLWKVLEDNNGTAVGTFTGDECLGGLANNRGTELCSVAELMYTCEVLYALTGEKKWLGRLERAAYNAFPATVSDDMWTHQYDQQVNQIACMKFNAKSFFGSNNDEAHLFGLEPHFGCCTANFNQAWPKLALSIWLRKEKTIEAALLLPSVLATEAGGKAVKITCETDYPFRMKAVYTVEAEEGADFELKLVIPSWAKGLKVEGTSQYTVSADGDVVVSGPWERKTELVVSFEDEPRLVKRPGGLYVAEYGALVFSLPIRAEYIMHEYVRDNVERKYPYCDYELKPLDEWRYGFAEAELSVVEKEGDSVPFSSKAPRIALTAKLNRVDWDFAEGYDTVADRLPVSEKPVGPVETVELWPYGCSKLRMTELPLCNE